LLVIQHHPYRTLPHLRCEFVRCLAHNGSFYSRVGASGNPGAVQHVSGELFEPGAFFKSQSE
ncbi:MAG: hypothetical protein ACSLFL_14995, partial [Alphaproteobacteria bacterium]